MQTCLPHKGPDKKHVHAASLEPEDSCSAAADQPQRSPWQQWRQWIRLGVTRSAPWRHATSALAQAAADCLPADRSVPPSAGTQISIKMNPAVSLRPRQLPSEKRSSEPIVGNADME